LGLPSPLLPPMTPALPALVSLLAFLPHGCVPVVCAFFSLFLLPSTRHTLPTPTPYRRTDIVAFIHVTAHGFAGAHCTHCRTTPPLYVRCATTHDRRSITLFCRHTSCMHSRVNLPWEAGAAPSRTACLRHGGSCRRILLQQFFGRAATCHLTTADLPSPDTDCLPAPAPRHTYHAPPNTTPSA